MEKQLKKKCTVPIHLFWGSMLYHINHSINLNTTLARATLLTSSSTVLKVFGSVKHVPQFHKCMEEVLHSMHIFQADLILVHHRK